ncbi:hypothetical protein [Mycetocola sp.]|uniref:DUF7275 domain-containing protein n=1 Tax=Mycetocola sp. TaxID=1871042 RepID=UPI00398A0CA6
MTHVLVGSKAMYHWFEDARSQKDIDYFSDELHGYTEEDGTRIETFWHPDLDRWNWGPVASANELYTIKVSHSFWELKNGSWSKHMMDILFLQSKGAILIPELYKILYKIWEETHGKKKVNLEADPETFFNDKIVKRVYDHDSIHESVAYYHRPLFERILRDDSDVAVDKSKWDAMDHEDKLKMVREEIYATALERKLVPSDYKSSPGAAYNWTLRKTITSLTKGWFALFVVENFKDLTKADIDYVKRHRDNAHMLRPYK